MRYTFSSKRNSRYNTASLKGALLRYVRRKAREDERRPLEDQLRQTQKLETLGQLTDGIAHDFNNISSILLDYREMARDDVPDGSRIQRKIQEAGHPSAGRWKSPSFMEESLRLLQALLPQIYPVIINLCLNAGYAMREDGKTLTVGLTTAEVDTAFADHHNVQEGVYVRLTLCDTGYGLIPDVQVPIFEPFFLPQNPRAKAQPSGSICPDPNAYRPGKFLPLPRAIVFAPNLCPVYNSP